MNKKIEKVLNNQIEKEASSSHLYLSMASWVESKGLNGTAKFLYTHSDEERFHMLKLIKFVNERGGRADIPALKNPQKKLIVDLKMRKYLLTQLITISLIAYLEPLKL